MTFPTLKKSIPGLLLGAWLVFVLADYYPWGWHQSAEGFDIWRDLSADWDPGRSKLFVLLCLGGFFSVILLSHLRQVDRHVLRRRLPWYIMTAVISLAVCAVHVIRTFPFGAEALSAHLTGLLGSGAVVLAGLALGRLACRFARWSFEGSGERLVYSLVLGFGSLSLLSVVSAFLGVYSAGFVRVGVGVLAFAGIGILVVQWLKPGTGGQARNAPHEAETSRSGDMFWKAMALIVALISLVGALAPEIEYDALWYHLWLPKLWLAGGAPVDVVREYVSLYPLNFDLLFGVGLAASGPVAAKLIHYCAMLTVAGLVYLTCKRFVPRANPWLAIALCVSTPTLLWEATTAYVDLGLAMFVAASTYALLRFGEAGKVQWFLLAAITLGFALGTKHLALLALLILTPAVALCLWRRGRPLPIALGGASAFALIALLLASVWYARAFQASGNPFFPDLYSVFGAEPPERWSPRSEIGLQVFKDKFGESRSLLGVLMLPYDITVRGDRFGGAFGPLFLMLIPGLLFLKRKPNAIGWLCAGVVVYLLLWSAPFSSYQARFIVPLVPFLSVMAAGGYQGFVDLLPSTQLFSSKRVLGIVVGVMMLLNLPQFTPLHESRGGKGSLTHVMREIPFSVLLGSEGQAEYLRRKVQTYAAWEYINRHLPDSARILTFAGGDQFYSERWRVWSDATIAYPATWGAKKGQEAEALASLKALGVTHVLLDRNRFLEDLRKDLAITQPHMIERFFEKVYEDRNATVFRLRWEVVIAQAS